VLHHYRELVQFGGKNSAIFDRGQCQLGLLRGGFNLATLNSNAPQVAAIDDLRRSQRQKGGLHSASPAFQYYASTPIHPCASKLVAMIGRNGDGREPSIDMQDFYDAVNAGNFPCRFVSEGTRVPGWPCRLLPIRWTSRPSCSM